MKLLINKTVSTSLSITLALTAFGCRQTQLSPATLPGGISVGNGLTLYQAEAGFQFHYDQLLALAEISNQKIIVSNTRLEASAKQPSTVTFDVLQSSSDSVKSVKGPEDLEALAEKAAQKDLVVVSNNGAHRVQFESESNGAKIVTQLDLSDAGLLVQSTAIIYSEQASAKLIQEIPQTLKLDFESPTLKSIQLPTGPIEAGGEMTIVIEATDNSGSINEYAVVIFQRTQSQGDIFSSIGNKMRALGENKYALTLKTPKFLVPGTYQIAALTLSDQWRNLRTYKIHNDGSYRSFQRSLVGRDAKTGDLFIELQEVMESLNGTSIEITNNTEIDREYPRIESITLNSQSFAAGETVEVHVKFADDVAGINPDSVSARIGEHGAIWLEEYAPISVEQVSSDEFKLNFKLGLGFPSGQYQVSRLFFADRMNRAVDVNLIEGYITHSHENFSNGRLTIHGDRTESMGSPAWGKQDSLRFTVVNEGQEMDRGPEVKTMRLNHERSVNGRVSLEIELKNDSELFAKGFLPIISPESRSVIDDGSIVSFIKAESQDFVEMTALGNRMYRFEFEMHPEAPKGVYVLSNIFLTSLSGHTSAYMAQVQGQDPLVLFLPPENDKPGRFTFGVKSVSDSFYTTEDHHFEDINSGIPLIRFEIK